MRRLTIGFSVVVMVLLLASVAGAVPPKCDFDPNLPGCPGDDPPTTTTTSTTTAPGLQACPTETWTISGGGQTSFECLWQPINDGSPVATATVSRLTGALSGPPTLFVRDDSPGDICVLLQGDEWDPPTESGYEASFDLFYDEIPVPTPENPDVLDYSAWLEQSYWDFAWQEGMEAGTHWCAPQDPVLWSIREDNNGGALIVTVSFNAKKGGSLDITLFPENSL